MTSPKDQPLPSAASDTTPAESTARIGVIGGSGFYSWLDNAEEVTDAQCLNTPFGAPSEPPLIGTVGGAAIAFIPRHGRDHRFTPHRVNYRANLWALRALGVRDVLGPCAVGSLRAELAPGALVVPDQVIDRTWGRQHTIFDDYAGQPDDHSGPLVHVDFADPYCPRGRSAVFGAAADPTIQWTAQDGGAMVVINGPRFSSRAESRWHTAAGGDIVGMTGMPEAAIARELGLCYTSIAVVTDHDAGVEAGQGVTQQEVLAEFARSVDRLKRLLELAVGPLAAARNAAPDDGPGCHCADAITGQKLPFALP